MLKPRYHWSFDTGGAGPAQDWAAGVNDLISGWYNFVPGVQRGRVDGASGDGQTPGLPSGGRGLAVRQDVGVQADWIRRTTIRRQIPVFVFVAPLRSALGEGLVVRWNFIGTVREVNGQLPFFGRSGLIPAVAA